LRSHASPHSCKTYPSSHLQLVGITGTNGKTTTAYITSHIAETAGETVALLGTIERRIGAHRERTEHTTPEASDTQRFLRRAVEAECKVAVMECSSQALDLRRCDSLDFAVAAWTKLTQDHLDYHGDMERYYISKRRLFDGSIGAAPRAAVINTDDAYGRRLLDELSLLTTKPARLITYALDRAADVRADDIHTSLDGMRFQLHTGQGSRAVCSSLVGRTSLYNILTATAAALTLGYDLDRIAKGIETCAGAPGRFERVANKEGFAVIVDYAHTPDALRNTLHTAREVAGDGRIITVFGCGGDRDRTKRPLMGEAAAKGSDLVYLTSDNPRTEDPQRIFDDTEAGLRPHATDYRIAPDRRAAIHEAIAAARPGDLVLIAGKGHEDYQITGTEKLHFDDREVAHEVLA
jgi:UDP-N-acetylmuramyl-tripeptide synthetase